MKKRLGIWMAVPLILLIAWFVYPDQRQEYSVSLDEIPVFSGTPYVVIDDNIPDFDERENEPEAFERYSPMDSMGRCGTAEACIGIELMPTEERGSIGQVKPSGWQTVKYDFVDGKYLYNRCHLIGFQLTGENANPENLITGTRYMNVEGMLPFENMVADYVRETGGHVLYRVTPIFMENELLARGVHMEAFSVEDNGEGICFDVYVYNHQPGVIIDYKTGDSREDKVEASVSSLEMEYILNTGSKKFHASDCSQSENIKQTNKEHYTGPGKR